jgi:hypothetical protein
VRPPRGVEAVRRLYGDPRPFVRDDGTVSRIWESKMVLVSTPSPLPLGWDGERYATRVRVNEAVAEEVEAVFRELRDSRAWFLLRTYDGGYVWRQQRGGSKISMHGFGGALDFDARWNRLGDEPTMDRRVVRIFEERGWTWGGRWRRPDGMHFQFAKGY